MVANRRRIRVAHVVPQLRVGGMEKLLAEFARHADRTRFDLRFVCLGESGPVAAEIAACGWPVTVMDKPKGLRPAVTADLQRLFADRRIEVVHAHNNAALLYAGPAAQLAGVPVLVQTRHGQAVGTSRKHRAAVRVVSLFADRIVCVSDDCRRLTAAERIPPRKLAVIRNGIDLTRFAHAGPRAGGPAVMVGRLVPLKGVDHLLRAVALVVRSRPDFRLHVAGGGEAHAGLVRLAGELGLAGHVRFLGEVGDVAGELAGASLFVLPSLSEGVSLTVLEAMARGLPVVTTDVGGNPETVAAGQTGLLVPPADPAALAEAILAVWADPARGRAMGEAGRRRVEERFDIRRVVAEYEALYRRVGRRNGFLAAAHA